MDQKQYPHPLVTIDEDRHQLFRVFATATIASIHDRFFVVTPYHALKHMDGKPAQIVLESGPLDLAKKTVITVGYLDLAIMELTPSEVDAIYPTGLFVTEDTLAPDGQNAGHCVLQGFPANRNKMTVRHKPFYRNLLQIFCVECTKNYEFEDQNFRTAQIALEYDERDLVDSHGKKANKRQLAGMSGGMVMRVLNTNDVKGGLPYGILLLQDNDQRALVCLRYSIILRCIDENLHRFDNKHS